MQSRYTLSLTQAKVLRSMSDGYELSPNEVAVETLLLPSQVVPAIDGLEKIGLVSSSYPVTGRTGERLVILTGDGRAVARALGQYRDVPPVGTVVPLPSGSLFSGFFSSGPVVASGAPHVLVASDKD